MSLICANEHEPARMMVKGQSKLTGWPIYSCPTCQVKIEVVGNGLYCGRDGGRMKRLGGEAWCPVCGLQARVVKTARPTMEGITALRPKAPVQAAPSAVRPQPSAPAQPKPTPAAAPTSIPATGPAAPAAPLPLNVDAKVIEAIMKLVDMKGNADLNTVKSILKLRLKQQEPDVQAYVKALTATGKCRLEGDSLVKA